MAEYNRDGRPDSPYYDNQLNSVIVDIGEGRLAIRTSGGGGGGGDATAENQVTQIGIEEQIRDYIGFGSGDTLNQLSVNTNDALSALFIGSIGSYEIQARTVSAGASIDISNTTLLAVVNTTTGHCVSVGSVFAIVTGITGIDNFNANYVQHNPSGTAQLFDFSRAAITGRTLDQQPSASKNLSGNISAEPVIVVTIKNTRF
jgi:hypothetical protein